MTATHLNEIDVRDLGALPRIRRTLVVLGVAVGLLMLGWECTRYLVLGAFLDHIEGNVVISAWQYVHGAPLYGEFDGAPLFATYYGPLAYVLEVPALALFGAGMVTSKLTSFLALASTVAVMAWHFRPSRSGQGLDGLLLLVGGLLFFSPVSYWVRPDPLEVLLVALAVVLAKSRWSAIGLGICIGLAVNLKVHAFLYFLPCVVELWSNSGWRAAARMTAVSAITFSLPFLAPGISLHDYVATLAMQIGHRANTLTARPFVDGMVFMGVPAILVVLALASAVLRTVQRERLYFCSIPVTLALLVYPATFPGAGAYHLLPLVPVVADAFNRMRANNIAARWAPISLVLAAIPFALANLFIMQERDTWCAVADEAAALAHRSTPQTIQIGYGDNSRSYEISQLSKARLALDGYPAIVDAQVLMELRYIGIDASTRWIPDLADCRFGTWLLPKDEAPFSVTSLYDHGLLFNEEFRRTFLDRYRLSDGTAHFDIWTCATRSGSR
jgi:hypothetical protein